MPIRNASDLTQRKTNQTKYFDHVRLREASTSGALGKFLINKDYLDVLNGANLEVDINGNTVGVDTRPISVTVTSNNLSIINTSTAVITITFDRPVNNSTFTANNLVVSGGTVSSFTHVSTTVTTCVFTPTSGSSGTATITLPVGTVTTLEGISNKSAAVSLVVTPSRLTATLSTTTPAITITETATIDILFNMPIVTSDLSIDDFSTFERPPLTSVSNLTIISSTQATVTYNPKGSSRNPVILLSGRIRSLADNTIYNDVSNTIYFTMTPIILIASYPGTPTSIQWWVNGYPIPGATNNTYPTIQHGSYYNTGDGSVGPYTSPTTIL